MLQSLQLQCCSGTSEECLRVSGACLANVIPSIEHTLETLGMPNFSWVAVEPGTESYWFNRVTASVTAFRYPQVQLVRPNFDGSGPLSLYNWQYAWDDSHH